MAAIQQVQSINEHPRTGVIQFGSDWPGVFISGDEALSIAASLRHVERSEYSNKLDLALAALRQVAGILEACRVEKR